MTDPRDAYNARHRVTSPAEAAVRMSTAFIRDLSRPLHVPRHSTLTPSQVAEWNAATRRQTAVTS